MSAPAPDNYLGVGWINPKTGVPMTDEEVDAYQKKKGECRICGTKTHEKKFHFSGYRMEPLTIPGLVDNGRCLTCCREREDRVHRNGDDHAAAARHPDSPGRARRRDAAKQFIGTGAARLMRVTNPIPPFRRSFEDEGKVGEEGNFCQSAPSRILSAPSGTGSDTGALTEDAALSSICDGKCKVSDAVRAMRKVPQSAEVQEHACKKLCELAAEMAESSDLPPGSRVAKAIAHAIDGHASNAGVQTEALRALWCLSVMSDDYRKHMASSPSLAKSTVLVLSVGSDPDPARELSEEMLLLALGCISSLCIRAEGQSKFTDEGAISAILRAMKKSGSSVIIQEWACRALSALSIHDAVAEELEVVAESMRRGIDDVTLQGWACSALCSIIGGSDGGVASVENLGDVVSVVVDVMRLHVGVSSIQERACAVLATLASSPEPIASIIDRSSDIAEDVCKAVSQFPHEKTLHTGACDVLLRLVVNNDGRSEILSDEDIACIIQAVSNSMNDAELQGKFCDLMLSLAIDTESSRSLVVSAGGIEAILNIAREHRDSLDVQEKAWNVLAGLAVSPENVEAIAESASFKSLLEAVRRNAAALGTRCDLFLLVCAFLSKACEDGHVLPTIAIDAIVKVMDENLFNEDIQSVDIQSVGCSFLSLSFLNSPSLKSYILSSGGVLAVVNAMRANENSVSVQERGCGALVVFGASLNENGAAHDTTAVLAAIKLAIGNHSDDHNVVEYGFVALYKLLAAGVNEATSVVFESIQEHPHSLQIHQHACHLLWRLSSADERCRGMISSADGIDIVVKVMKAYPGVETIQEESCNVLWNVYCANADQITLVTPNVLMSVVDAMQHNEENVNIQERACATLSWLSSDDRVKAMIMSIEPTVHTVINAMKCHPASSSVVKDCCTILSRLAVDDSIKHYIEALCGVEAISDAMENHCHDTQIQEEACSAFCSLVSAVDNEVFLQADIIPRVVDAMRTHKNSQRIQEGGLDFIRAMSLKDPRNKVVTAEAGGIEAIVSTMQMNVRNDNIQEKACVLLWSLAVNEDNQTAVAFAGGIEAIINAMLAHIVLLSVQEGGLGALTTLAVNSVNNRIISEKRGTCAIVYAMRAHYRSPEIQLRACHALSNIACDRSTTRSCDVISNEVDAIVSAMWMHKDSRIVQEAACLALWNYSFNPTYKTTLRKNRHVVNMLRAAAREFPSECQERAAYLLSSLE